jgi:hypothetical protein
MAKNMFSSRKVGEQPFNFWGGGYVLFFSNRTCILYFWTFCIYRIPGKRVFSLDPNFVIFFQIGDFILAVSNFHDPDF